jgi:pseudouridylate synthase I
MTDRNISLVISYDGTGYHGWQCQPGVVTVQEIVRNRVERILDHGVKLFSAARTDAGVHALGQVVNFHSHKEIALRNLERGLNSMLPGDIRVEQAREVEPEFHARYSAKSKTYFYCILNRPHSSPFYGRYAWHIPYEIDARLMGDTIRIVKGEHDFSAFKKKDEFYRNAVRNVLRTGVRRRGDLIFVVLEATGFLRYMVRNIVGTLVEVGTGRIEAEAFRTILDSRDRGTGGAYSATTGGFF